MTTTTTTTAETATEVARTTTTKYMVDNLTLAKQSSIFLWGYECS